MKSGAPLQCTYVVEGHSSSVLSIQVNENRLYTGAAGKFNSRNYAKFSKYKLIGFTLDRTVRVWDLEKGSGPLSLIPHPGPVASVVYDKKTNLLFSACGAFVRVWDSRDGYSKALKTLR